MKINAIVLAAGKGSRLDCDFPKCGIKILGKPMIVRIIEELESVKIDNIIVVLGYMKDKIIDKIDESVKVAIQEEQLGTGHAVKCGIDFCEEGITLVVPGDMPFINSDIIRRLITNHLINKYDATIVTNVLTDSRNYGRVKRNNNKIVKITEARVATKKELEIKEVNSGLMCFNTNILKEYINKIEKNKTTNEYYLTDIVEQICDLNVGSITYVNDYKLLGINTIDDITKIMEIKTNNDRL